MDHKTSQVATVLNIPESDLCDKSRIYGNSRKPLTKYQQAVNMASYQLCKDDGSLLMNRGKLLSLAREKVHNDGYNYSKKSSRSRVFGSHEEKEKRQHVRGEVREARMIELTENISSQEAIKFLQQQKTKYSNTEKFLEAAEITKSIQEENTKKRNWSWSCKSSSLRKLDLLNIA